MATREYNLPYAEKTSVAEGPCWITIYGVHSDVAIGFNAVGDSTPPSKMVSPDFRNTNAEINYGGSEQVWLENRNLNARISVAVVDVI